MKRLLLLLAISSSVFSQFQQVQTTAQTYNSIPLIDSRGQNSFSNGNGMNTNGNGGNSFNHYQPYVSPSSSALTGGGTNFQFTMRSFSDPGSRTPDGGVCRCPQGISCGDEDRCSFTFTFIVATPNQKSEIYETPEIRLDPNGDLPLTLSNEWGRTFIVNINGRPSSLDVLVHHRGLTYDDTGRPLSASKLLLVDRFHVDLETILPAVGGTVQSLQNSNDYSGQILNTRMSLSMALSCSSQSLIGPDCDLKCNRSTTISNVASCRSESTGYFAICNWAVGQPNQVENCQRCPWGVRDDTHCQDEDGGVLYPDRAGVVDGDFRTATIVLSIILFVVVVLLGALVTYLCMKTRNLSKKEEQLPGHNVRAAEPPAVTRPLLQTRYSNDSGHNTPTPAPRHMTPTGPSGSSMPGGVAVLPPKSALKKPPPPAYMGGSNSLNESVNTSYNDMPRAMQVWQQHGVDSLYPVTKGITRSPLIESVECTIKSSLTDSRRKSTEMQTGRLSPKATIRVFFPDDDQCVFLSNPADPSRHRCDWTTDEKCRPAVVLYSKIAKDFSMRNAESAAVGNKHKPRWAYMDCNVKIVRREGLANLVLPGDIDEVLDLYSGGPNKNKRKRQLAMDLKRASAKKAREAYQR